MKSQEINTDARIIGEFLLLFKDGERGLKKKGSWANMLADQKVHQYSCVTLEIMWRNEASRRSQNSSSLFWHPQSHLRDASIPPTSPVGDCLHRGGQNCTLTDK